MKRLKTLTSLKMPSLTMPRLKMTGLNKCLGLILSCGVFLAPIARAQDDDDMPDGDIDIQEEKKKPKKATPKKDPPKKAAEPLKKADPPAKKAEPKRTPSDDDDILTGDDAPKPKTTTRAPSLNDVLVDDDDMPGGSAPAVKKAEPKREPTRVITLPTRRLDDDEPPRREIANPARAPAPQPGDDIPETVTPVRRLDETAPDDDESEGPPAGLIVGGAIGGAVLVLAGAGIGGYFLFSSLADSGTTSVTIVPR